MKTLLVARWSPLRVAPSLSYAGILTTTSIVPLVCFAVALILALLHVMNVSDRRY
jgi:hypothetical protein